MPPRVVPLSKIAPIIPIERPLPFDDPDWLFEPKFDGLGGLLYIDQDTATFHSKRGLVFKRFSRFAAEVREALNVRSAILDGEVLAIDETGQHNFRSLMSSASISTTPRSICWLNRRDLRGLPLIKRRPLLERTTPLLSRIEACGKAVTRPSTAPSTVAFLPQPGPIVVIFACLGPRGRLLGHGAQVTGEVETVVSLAATVTVRGWSPATMQFPATSISSNEYGRS